MNNATHTRKHRMLVSALNLIPYFQSHPNASLMEAATDLGIDLEELHNSLTQLFCTGVGRGTEDLIDLTYSYRDGVTIREDQGLNKPLRLTATEAGALLLTLEALESTPGLADRDAVVSAAVKLRTMMDAKTRGIYDSLGTAEPADSEAQEHLSRAIEKRHRARFSYWSARSSEWTRREVDPARLFLVEDTAYIIAWEPAAEDHRTFRIDRMREVEIIPDHSEPHTASLNFDPADPFDFSESERAAVSIRRDATWLAEMADLELGEDGTGESEWLSGSMPLRSTAWAARFAVGEADRVRVHSPESLRQTIADKVAAGLDRYTQ